VIVSGAMTLEYTSAKCVVLLVLAVLVLSCASQDVRMGMAGGNGAKLSYRVVGKGEVLVVIHDGPGGEKSLLYDGFDALSDKMKVIYYDQRGCGRSEPISAEQSCTIEDNVNDLEALRSYLHLDRFSIAAHGWGAVIAIEYSRKYPEYVDSIILITPVSPYSPGLHIEDLITRLPLDGQQRLRAVLDNPFATMLEKREQFVRAVFPMLFYDGGVRDRVDLEHLRYSPDVDARLSTELKSLNLFVQLGDVSRPTLIIAGRHDLLTPLAEQMAYVDGITTSMAVVFNESGHFPFLEESGAFVNQVGRFISRGDMPPLATAGPISE
jgi:proline iminopeptidase